MIFDIIDYLGKFEEGVVVLLSLNYNDEYYDATFYYVDDYVAITIDEDLEEHIGLIEQWDGYNDLILSIMSKVVPYDEIIGRLDEIEFDNEEESN